jgi:hypothetical protein
MNENLVVTEVKDAANLFIGWVKFTASPKSNKINITGLPIGTKAISATITEFNEQNGTIAGHAIFYTKSVQLHSNGTQCRIVYEMDGYNKNLLALVSLIYG